MKKLYVLALSMLFVLGLATTAFAASYNDPTFTTTINDTNKLTTVANDTYNDNGLNNANFSGVGVGGQDANFTNVIKSNKITKYVDTKTGAISSDVQRTHGEYQNNTNSCASCHQTHTAAASDLLFKSSVYATCTACHDGTLGFYNVFNASTAGTFGGTADGGASMHLASGAAKISAAPGGNSAANTEGGWNNDFSCNSCHTPHGSYGDRLLHFDPNGMADAVPTEGGQRFVADLTTAKLVADLPAEVVAGTTYVVYDTYANMSSLGYAGTYATNNAFYNQTVSDAAKTANKMVVLVTADGGKWKIDTTPWFYEYEFDSNHKNRYYSIGFWRTTEANWTNGEYPTVADLYKVGNSTTPDCTQLTLTAPIQVDPQNAFAYGDFAGIKRVSIAKVIVTKLPLVDAGSVSGFTYKTVKPEFYAQTKYTVASNGIAPNTGVGVSKFCAACHTAYFTSSGGNEMFGNSAYRHTTTSDSYMCLRCHFAHGTDVTVMTDAMDRGLTKAGKDGQTAVELFTAAGSLDAVADATAYLKDSNPSSALKRYTNMAVCWKCHTSSHSAGFKNTDYYKEYGVTGGTNVTSTIPSGF